MDLNTAASICRPLDGRTFQDQTLDLADELTGAVNREHARQEAQAAVAPEYRNAACELERIAINLKAYARGMVGKQVVPSYIKQAREALDAMEAAL